MPYTTLPLDRQQHRQPAAFDPWTATLSQAIELDGASEGTGISALVQYQAAQKVQALREACLSNDGGCKVLECLAACLATELAPPAWLKDAFIDRHSRVVQAHVATWDRAFGTPWPRGVRLDHQRKKMRLKEVVHSEVWRRVMSETPMPINNHLFAQIGALPGIHRGHTTVEKIYRAALSEGHPDPLVVRRREARNPRPSTQEARIDFLLASIPAH